MVTLQWFGRPYLAQHNFGPQEISYAQQCAHTPVWIQGGMRLKQSVAIKNNQTSSIGPKIIVYGILDIFFEIIFLIFFLK